MADLRETQLAGLALVERDINADLRATQIAGLALINKHIDADLRVTQLAGMALVAVAVGRSPRSRGSIIE